MKKLMMAAAAVVGLGAGFANAEEMNIDFDGKGIGSMNFIEAVQNIDSCQNDNITGELPRPAAVSENTGMPGELKTEGAMVNAEPVFSPRMVIDMDESIGTAIAYVQEHQQGQKLKASFECLRRAGTPEQKFAFVYGTENTFYRFPENCVTKQSNSNSGNKYCISWGSKEKCVDKQVYHDVCNVLAGACVLIGGVTTCAAPTIVCHAVASIIPECTQDPYCIIESGGHVVDPAAQS